MCFFAAVVLGGRPAWRAVADQAEKPGNGDFEAAEKPGNGDFEAGHYRDAEGHTLPYRLLRPGEEAPERDAHPLLVFLHGAGERGSDNRAQLKHGKAMMRNAASRYGTFVLVPQCPEGSRWVEVDWRLPSHKMPKKASQPMRLLVKLMAGLQEQHPIDARRVYVMGLSMGGFGTWDMIQRHPEMFAAAVPICGGGDETRAKRIAGVPVWAFHGAKDRVVPVGRSRNMIEAIRAAGGKPKYTEYPEAGHFAWVPAFKNPRLLEWLFSHERLAKK